MKTSRCQLQEYVIINEEFRVKILRYIIHAILHQMNIIVQYIFLNVISFIENFFFKMTLFTKYSIVFDWFFFTILIILRLRCKKNIYLSYVPNSFQHSLKNRRSITIVLSIKKKKKKNWKCPH